MSGESSSVYSPPSDGLPEMRQAIADFYTEHLGVTVPMSTVVVGSGARP